MTAPTTQRRVTPTAYLVLPATADRAVWLAERRNGIGSSDVAAILGVSDYATAVHVYRDKIGIVSEDQAGEAAYWGTVLEDKVAQDWCRRNASVIRKVGLVAHVDHDWMRATLDRRVLECPLNRESRESCALEIKCRSAFKGAKWKRDVPDDVLAQVQWQAAVTGFDHVHVAVLIGGNDYRQTVIRVDPAITRLARAEAEQLWFGNVLASVEPDWDYDRAAKLIELDERTHPNREGTLPLTVQAWGEVAEYIHLSMAKGEAEKALKRQAAVLRKAANGHEVMTFDNELAYEIAERTRSNVDLDVLAERFPEAYAACVTTKTHHQINVPAAARTRAGATA